MSLTLLAKEIRLDFRKHKYCNKNMYMSKIQVCVHPFECLWCWNKFEEPEHVINPSTKNILNYIKCHCGTREDKFIRICCHREQVLSSIHYPVHNKRYQRSIGYSYQCTYFIPGQFLALPALVDGKGLTKAVFIKLPVSMDSFLKLQQ